LGCFAAAQKLANFAISKRPQMKVVGFYSAIGPLQEGIASGQNAGCGNRFDLKNQATLAQSGTDRSYYDLREAYVAALSIEKSLTKKDQLLKSANAEGTGRRKTQCNAGGSKGTFGTQEEGHYLDGNDRRSRSPHRYHYRRFAEIGSSFQFVNKRTALVGT
jgi:hypothetical protein